MDIKTKLYVTKIFDNDLVAIQKSKIKLTLNRQAYVAMYILNLSRVLMYEFHYDYIKNEYNKKWKSLFTDIDSNYSAKLKFYDDSNKLVLGKKTDETVGVPIKEFI